MERIVKQWRRSELCSG